VKLLVGSLADSPFVARIDQEEFDNAQPGVLRFDFVVTVDAAQEL
jgi:type IV pilus assembly protein PilM